VEQVIVQQLVNWLVLASIYTLLAIGFSLLFGVLDIVHFSHGDVSLIAPFVALAVFQALLASAAGLGSGPALLAACLLAVAAVGGLGQAHPPERRPRARQQRQRRRLRARMGCDLEPGDDTVRHACDEDGLGHLSLVHLPYLDSEPRSGGKPCPKLRQLVSSVRVLHLGWRVSAERSGVELCGRRREPAALLSVVESRELSGHRR
jgi:hypothetical protein